MKEERKKEVGKVGMCELADVKSELMPSQRGCLAERSRCQNLLAVAARPVLSSPRVCGGGMWTQVEKRCPPRGSPDCPAHSRHRSTAPVGGQLSPAQVAASISCRPSNVPGFNVRRQVPAGSRPALWSWVWKAGRMRERGCPHWRSWARSVRAAAPSPRPRSCRAHRRAGSSCPLSCRRAAEEEVGGGL